MGLLSGVSEEDAVVWRGPKKQSMIGQLLKEVAWDDLDVVVIDTPPGTSDEHLSMVKTLKETGVLAKTTSILVTTPQMASLQDVAREINFCTKESLKIGPKGHFQVKKNLPINSARTVKMLPRKDPVRFS